MEKKLQTKRRNNKVTKSIIGLYCVDAWLIYKGCTLGSGSYTPKPSQ